METLKGYIHVVSTLPEELLMVDAVLIDCPKKKLFDYAEVVLPVLRKHKVVRLRPAAAQRADRYPLSAKATRCQACYRALRLVRNLEEKAEAIVHAIPRPFLALHLRFEPDMVAYSRCLYTNLSRSSLDSIEAARDGKTPFAGAQAVMWRKRGKCPLTPAEAASFLLALQVPRSMSIYLASGGGLMEIAGFTSVYSNIFRKSELLPPEALAGLHENAKAALDYHVAIRSDAYVATYFGNMDKMVVAMRALESRTSIVLNRKAFAEATDEGLQDAALHSRLRLLQRSQEILPLPDCLCRQNA